MMGPLDRCGICGVAGDTTGLPMQPVRPTHVLPDIPPRARPCLAPHTDSNSLLSLSLHSSSNRSTKPSSTTIPPPSSRCTSLVGTGSPSNTTRTRSGPRARSSPVSSVEVSDAWIEQPVGAGVDTDKRRCMGNRSTLFDSLPRVVLPTRLRQARAQRR